MNRRFRLVWTQTATRDYSALLEYVAVHDSVGAARRLDKKLDKRILALKALPSRCRVVPELRRAGLDVYREAIVSPFRIVFRLRGHDIVLLGVLDGRRDLEELLVARALGE